MSNDATVQSIVLGAENAARDAQVQDLMRHIALGLGLIRPKLHSHVIMLTCVNLVANLLLGCPVGVQDAIMRDLQAALDRARAAG
jgi:hypothetical protein